MYIGAGSGANKNGHPNSSYSRGARFGRDNNLCQNRRAEVDKVLSAIKDVAAELRQMDNR